MNWLSLILAGMLEIVWAIGLKYTQGFTKLMPSIITILAMLGSIILLGFAMKTIPISTAYAIWVGIGVMGTFILGVFLFNEPYNLMRIVSIILIILGIIGLKVS